MAIKDLLTKLNLSGTGAKLAEKLAALRQKLPFKKKDPNLEHPPHHLDDLPADSAQASHTFVDDGPTDPGIPLDASNTNVVSVETPNDSLIAAPKKNFFSGLADNLRGGAARIGGMFKRKATPTPEYEPGMEPGAVATDAPAPASTESVPPFVAPEGNAFKRYTALAGYKLKNLSTNFRAQAKTLATQLKENFPKNMEDLKKIQPDELFERMRKLTGGRASGMYVRLGAAAFASYFLADTVSLFTDSMIPDAPPVPAPIVRRATEDKRRSANEYAAILERNIFSAKNVIPEDKIGEGVAQKTNLPLNLIGTVVLRDEKKSIATIEDKSQNMVFPVRVGDTMNDRIEITKIQHLRVEFINKTNNRLEFVEIVDDQPALRVEASRPAGHGDGGITKLDDTHITLDQKVIKDGMANLNEVLQQARAIPNFENGMPDGYKILQIVPGSVFDKLGIKNGDVIVALNGEAVNDPGKALGLLNDLPNANHVEIGVKRGGRKMNMSYDIR
ncbi:MAG: PDZ domain-containing protein [Deltaproteobacteria bacterium]|nr:PDZ domain-containing protein [Deltaproteobacteria bacterium]